MRGGTSSDKLYGQSGSDKLYGDSGNDYLSGGSSKDNLYGGSGKDKLKGGTSADYLYGGTGNDKLYGGSGNDTLIGGTGKDDLYGGSGHDIFRLTTGSGYDRIRDFKLGEDLIDLGGLSLSQVNAFNSGNNIKIYKGNSDLLAVLYGYDMSDLLRYINSGYA